MKNDILIALGSNTDAENNMQRAMEMLHGSIEQVRFSTPVWTTAIGMEADDFLNCVAIAHDAHDFAALRRLTKKIERACGDSLPMRRKGHIAMDIDILLCQGERHHPDDWQRPYIQEGIRQLQYRQ